MLKKAAVSSTGRCNTIISNKNVVRAFINEELKAADTVAEVVCLTR